MHSYSEDNTVSRSIRLGTNPAEVHSLAPRADMLVTMLVNDINKRSRERLEQWGNDESLPDDRTLEYLLRLPKAFCSIQVVSADAWSGRDEYLESTRYSNDVEMPIIAAPFVMAKHEVDQQVRRTTPALGALRQVWLRAPLHQWMLKELQPDLEKLDCN